MALLITLLYFGSCQQNQSLVNSAEYHMQTDFPSQEQIDGLPEDGGDEFNRLIFESSPYLLQHARNPIDWRAWGKETLQLALDEDKPIFLSIGYTTCHWCHVMERESFEDPEVARLLNENYISIKVDREERPDLDNVYMSVTQMMTGRGGWPMTVIMSPEKIPFFAGTYFPKSSMLDLLPHFARIWKEEREKAEEIGQAIIQNLNQAQASQRGGDLNSSHLDRCFEALSISYDTIHGGFGDQPKFPTPHALSFLLRYHQRTANIEALEMVTHTLKQIRLSGTYDQIGSGIHRYSTDNQWLVPHFEKMLYDQALFSIACIEAYQITKDPFFKESCESTLAYVNRELSSPAGGFYSAEDADSEGEEGKFYIWTNDEIHQVLDEDDAVFFIELFNFENGGNFTDEATGKRTGSNIPHLKKTLAEYARLKEENLNELNLKLEKIRNSLFQAREKRIHPQLDDKVLTDWNGLMISAFARSGQALNNKEYIDRAMQAANFCLKELRQSNGRLLKRWRQGKAGLPAHLEDYAFLAQGLLDLFEATQEPSYLIDAKQLVDLARNLFEDQTMGGFFLTAKDGEKLLTRPKEIYDGAIPSGNSIMAMNLARLWKITGNAEYNECLEKVFSAFSGFLQSYPSGAENFLHSLAFVLNPPHEIVLFGNLNSPDTRSFQEEVNRYFLPFKTFICSDPKKNNSKLLEIAPYLDAFSTVQESTLFICRDLYCEEPINDLLKAKSKLAHIAEPKLD